MPPKRRASAPTTAEQHAEWVRLLHPDGPFLSLPVLTEVFPSGLDTVDSDLTTKLRLAWDEVQEQPDLLAAAWYDLIIQELLRYTPSLLAEGGALPDELRQWSQEQVRPDAVTLDRERTERLHLYRRPWNEPLTKAGKRMASAVDQAANLCRRRGVPLALLTNGRLWVLVHARPGEPTTVASFDADLWLEERSLLRAFTTLLDARRVLRQAGTESLADLFARSAAAQAEVTTTLGTQVRRAAELLVDELGRLDREAGGQLLTQVEPRRVYQGALTVMMRTVFLLYAEEQRLLPIDSELYAESYSVAGLYDRLEDERGRYGDEVGDRRSAAWPRLLATFAAVHGGSQHEELRIPPYGGALFDPDRFWWLTALEVSDRVVREVLDALLVLRRGRTAERLSYKGLDVEQIGHVYEGLLEFSCLRVNEPYVGLFGKKEPELPLAELERAAAGEDFAGWLQARSGETPKRIAAALGQRPSSSAEAGLHVAADNDTALTERAKPYLGLLRTDLRGLPTLFPTGSLLITQVGDRRSTGTHYTPRSLAEEVVEHTLAPLCYSPGPAEGAEPSAWRAKTADELLALKVLDPAMGSGAFLVSACRYLAARVVEAWERDGVPDKVWDAVGPDADRDGLLLEAQRRVAARCLYGVDRDEQAVELAKLSLWLVTLAKDRPFSFLDHALRCGDSLVGLVSEEQVAAFHLEPARGRLLNLRLHSTVDEATTQLLTRVQVLREEIEAEPVRDATHAQVLASKLREAERLTSRLRIAADAVVAAALSSAGQTKRERGPRGEEQRVAADDLFEDRLTALADDAQTALGVDKYGEPTPAAEKAKEQIRTLIEPWLRGPRAETIRPLHWGLEFPEVMRRGGFDAVVGNPPFSGGSKLTGNLGEDMREYFVERVSKGKRGNADLCAYFLLRDLSLSNNGRVGIITTNTISQGDTREVGLDQAVSAGWRVYRANKSQPWPGEAALEVSLVWAGRPASIEEIKLDQQKVTGITSSLDAESKISGNPYRLAANSNKSFNGSKVLGQGFILKPDRASDLLAKNKKYKEVLQPYINGEDLNQKPKPSASRWVINFHNWSDNYSQKYTEAYFIVERFVKPVRMKDNRKSRRDRWWQFAERAPALYEAVADLDRVLVIALTSKTGLPMWQPTGQVFSHMLGVFATDQSEMLTLLSSTIHFDWWTIKGNSTLESRLRYTPSDGFETFPQPRLTERMDRVGIALDSHRGNVMSQQHLPLTSLYNLVHTPTHHDPEIQRLREIHTEIDEAVREAYALDEGNDPRIREFETKIASEPLPTWREIDLGHGFHQTRQGVRFTISPQAQTDVLDKLLALNHYRHQQEVEQGVTAKKKRPAKKKATPSNQPVLDDGLFPPDDTLF